MKKALLFIFILLFTSASWAQNRYALVIGNANYPKVDDRLPNAINDTNAVSAALRDLGFSVELKQNLWRLDMVREISAFMTRLGSSRNSEGFLWYAGHAMEINGESLLFPLDVNVENDELIRATSFSVADLTRQFGDVKNKVNILVLDACRVPPSDSKSRGVGDTTRVIKTVPFPPPDLFVFYSTAPGTVALDGTGKWNSPFAEAFLKNVWSTEPLTIMAGHVTSDTLSLTGHRQRPYTSGSMSGDNTYYSLNPAGVRPSPVVPPVVPPVNPSPPQGTYNIGDRGPAGGIIFYDKGNNSNGWRYLEAAPADLKMAIWGLAGEDVTGTRTGIGDGKRNTERIIAALNRKDESGTAARYARYGLPPAAQLCVAYSLNGYSDWFLPSIDELDLMYENLKQRGLGGFNTTGNYYYWTSRYWSSSQHSNRRAWYLLFDQEGGKGILEKGEIFSVRAVRAF